jgi:hypothetical protein
MSKKLIAVAAAAALALTGLVVMPTAATATGPFAVAVTGQETTNQVNRTGATATNPLQIMVPSNDVLRSEAADGDTLGGDEVPANSNTALRLAITTPGATDAITITSTGGVKVLTETQFTATAPAPTTATGVQSLTVPAASGKAIVYAYTTSTTAGTVVISAAGSSRTIHVQGISTVANNIYKLAFTAPSTGAIGGTVTITGTVRDMFDNLLTPTAANLTVTALGGNLATSPAVTDFKVNATTKVVTFKVPTAATATQQAYSIVAASPADEVDAFPGYAVSVFALVSSVDLATQVTALTAQVAALQATIADMRTKARSVTLKRWNDLVLRHRALGGSAKLK